MYIELKTTPNPDFPGGPEAAIPRTTERVEVDSLEEAAEIGRQHHNSVIGMGGGGGNSLAKVYDDDGLVATVSWNGRIWDASGEEIDV